MVTWLAANAATIIITDNYSRLRDWRFVLSIRIGEPAAVRARVAAEDSAVAAMAALRSISRTRKGEVDGMNQTDALEEKRSYVIRELKRNGCRITNQRQI